jgi:hypothetical protein
MRGPNARAGGYAREKDPAKSLRSLALPDAGIDMESDVGRQQIKTARSTSL